MGKEWTSVRLQRSTHEALSALRLQLENTYREGRADYGLNRDDLISLDRVVELLVDQYWAKRLRSGSKARDAALELLSEWMGEKVKAEQEEDE
jgi:hypothetical protein